MSAKAAVTEREPVLLLGRIREMLATSGRCADPLEEAALSAVECAHQLASVADVVRPDPRLADQLEGALASARAAVLAITCAIRFTRDSATGRAQLSEPAAADDTLPGSVYGAAVPNRAAPAQGASSRGVSAAAVTSAESEVANPRPRWH